MAKYRPERWARGRAFLDALKARPCMDCGVQYPPEVMDFDHVRGVKRGNIGANVNRGLVWLLEETSKCDVVCANCHRLRTRAQRQK